MNKLAYFPPPVVALLLLLAAYGIHLRASLWEVFPASSGGFAWLAAGVFLAATAAWQFRQLQTTVLPHGTPTCLVTMGAYLWSRNPMYLGVLTALVGIAFYMGELPFWLVPPAFFLIVNRLHIPYEESRLEGAFGEDYRAYLQQVRRWL